MRKVLLTSAAAGALMAAALPASAADLAVRPPPAPYVAPVPVFTWSGFYIGGNAGAAWRDREIDVFDPTFVSGFPGVTITSGGFFNNDDSRTVFTGGGQLGFNWQMNQFVFGLEGDVNYLGRRENRFIGATTFTVGAPAAPAVRGTYTVSGFTSSDEGNWFATARGRLGLAYNRFLIYATGGAAFHDSGNDAVVTITGPAGMTTFTGTRSDDVGWAAGGGLEFAVTNNVSLGVEYLHLGFGGRDVVDPIGSVVNGFRTVVRQNEDVDLVRAKLNIKTNGLFGIF